MDDWAAQLDSERQIDVMLTDFAKAFDSFTHRRLLYKLKA